MLLLCGESMPTIIS